MRSEFSQPFQFNDGGCAAAGFGEPKGGCAARAIAIATGKPYAEVHKALQNAVQHQLEVERKQGLQYGFQPRTRPSASPDGGLPHEVYAPYLEWLGWEYVAKPLGRDGKPLRLQPRLLPKGRLIVQVSRHLTAVIDNVVHDTYYPTKGRRPVQGYFHKPE